MIGGTRGTVVIAIACALALAFAVSEWTALATLPFFVAIHLLKTLLGWINFAWRL